jgi:hypothetical protein
VDRQPRQLSLVVALALASCTSADPPAGRIVVAVTLDWEGAYMSLDGLDAFDEARKHLGDAPVTHFVSAAYFTKKEPDPKAVATLKGAIRAGDELAIHLHLWASLATSAGIVPRTSPSFLTGTDKLIEFDDGDLGFDTDLDTCSTTELRALIRTSRKHLEQVAAPSWSFRPAAYLGTPKVLQAIHDEGYVVDSSATDARQLGTTKNAMLAARVKEVWPTIDDVPQPFAIAGRDGLLEVPIAVTLDYVDAAKVLATLDAAHAKLAAAPERNVYVVIGLNQETALEFAPVLGSALGELRKRAWITEVVFTTVEKAAELARREP